MKNFLLTLTTGFALFSMFFGSGNLVFPLALGQTYPHNLFNTTLGILLTGVLVPFLGVYGMILFDGDKNLFFKPFGTRGCFYFSFLSLSLMGPFGVLARCLTVAHGSIQLIFPSMNLPITSGFLCAILFLLTINRKKILPILGGVLTPILLLSLIFLTVYGLWKKGFQIQSSFSQWQPFKEAFLKGYQTMDLLAAFFFSHFIIDHLKQESSLLDSPKVLKRASLIGASLLASVYVALVALGSCYTPLLVSLPPQEMLGTLAYVCLGPLAAPIICLVVVLACITTAIVLVTLFSSFLREEVCDQAISESLSIAITLLIGFTISTLDFAGIAHFISPILEVIYPALITLTIINISHKLWRTRLRLWPAAICLGLKLYYL
jgi:LIVCS family branched-chain amino acid:cation transporter